jgi:hypothetical protein
VGQHTHLHGVSSLNEWTHTLSALVDLLLGLLLLPLAESGIGSGTGEPVILDLLPDLGAILDLLGRLLLLLKEKR